MVEVPEHLLQRSRERRAALGLGGGDAGDAPAPAASPATQSAAAAPAAAAPSAPAAPAEPAAPAPKIGIPTVPLGQPLAPRTRVPVWAMPALAILPFWAVLYAGAFGERHPAEAGPAEALALVEGAPEGAKVSLVGLEFDPTSVTVATGETVRWVWTEQVAHNVTSTGGGHALESPTNQGPDYAVTFVEAGEYPYECTLHAGMTGTVVVE